MIELKAEPNIGYKMYLTNKSTRLGFYEYEGEYTAEAVSEYKQVFPLSEIEYDEHLKVLSFLPTPAIQHFSLPDFDMYAFLEYFFSELLRVNTFKHVHILVKEDKDVIIYLMSDENKDNLSPYLSDWRIEYRFNYDFPDLISVTSNSTIVKTPYSTVGNIAECLKGVLKNIKENERLLQYK